MYRVVGVEADYLDRRDHSRTIPFLVCRLERLGYSIRLEPILAAVARVP